MPFKITSKTTGESHVIVTDGNGQASTAASWNAHTTDTNGGTARSGVWFGAPESDDAKGTLPYDTYIVEEQRCDANADRALIPAFDVSVYRDAVAMDLGTLTNDAPPTETPPAPGVQTEATDADDGDHETVADDTVTTVDTVSYTGLTPGRECTLAGTLVDRETGEPVRAGGKAATSAVAFVPDAADGTQEVPSPSTGRSSQGMRSWPSSHPGRPGGRDARRHRRRGADREPDGAAQRGDSGLEHHGLQPAADGR